MSKTSSTRWAEASVWIVLTLAFFGSCVICVSQRPDAKPIIQINQCDKEN